MDFKDTTSFARKIMTDFDTTTYIFTYKTPKKKPNFVFNQVTNI